MRHHPTAAGGAVRVDYNTEQSFRRVIIGATSVVTIIQSADCTDGLLHLTAFARCIPFIARSTGTGGVFATTGGACATGVAGAGAGIFIGCWASTNAIGHGIRRFAGAGGVFAAAGVAGADHAFTRARFIV